MNATLGTMVAGAILGVCGLGGLAAQTNPVTLKPLPPGSMLTMGGVLTTPERKASPPFAGNALPEPPEQHAAWAPPAVLSTNLLSATALLFEQGMADPRGCEYREIEVGTGSVWGGDSGVFKTRGWVLPGGGEQRFAICWNALVYPAVSVGALADLDADTARLISNGFRSWRPVVSEAASVAVETRLGIRGCLLLRLGKVTEATNYWFGAVEPVLRAGSGDQVIVSGLSGGTRLQPEPDPYLTWATDWAWTLFDRLLCAHVRGDQKLALADARRLASIGPQIEAACAQRGFPRPPSYASPTRGQDMPYLSFLDQLPELLADLERRERERPRSSLVSRGLTNITDQAERVKALIQDLDLVQARQWGQPGGVNLTDDPVVAALIAEGDVAVEPLLDCLDQDKRLTRSVGFGRDFHRGRTLFPVHRVAFAALQTILQAGFSHPAELRAYWNQYKHLKLEDRWYVILQDEQARPRWQEAASCIVQPQHVAHFPGGFSTERPLATNEAPRLRGEVLRAKTDPSVSQLLTRRALEVPTNDVAAYDLSACCQMAGYLARWDVQAALPVAKTLSKRASTVMKYSGQQLGNHLTTLSMARAKAGDPAAFDDYVAWIETTQPGEFEQGNLEPFKTYPTNAALQAAAEKLFGQTNTAWGRFPWKTSFGRTVVQSELVPLAAYRTLLCRELEKTNICGTVTLQRPGYLSYYLTNLINQAGSFGFTLPAHSTATNGSSAVVRWCDWIALSLANSKHIDPIDPFSSPDQRDKAIQKAKTQLHRFPGR